MDEMLRQYINTWLIRLAHGDAQALDAIYHAIGGRMLSVALGIVRNTTTAEDVVQDSFIQIVRHADQFRVQNNGYAWICKIVRNTALNRLKADQRRPTADIDDFYSLSDGFSEVANTELTMLVEGAMKNLPKEERRVVYLKYFVQMTVREIAEETGMSKSSVDRAIDRAEEKLRGYFGTNPL